MAKEGNQAVKESHGDTLSLLQGASPEELLQIAAGTALRAHLLIKNFNDANAAAFYHKTDDLRKLIVREWRKHADFRGMVNLAIAKMQMKGKGSANPEQTKGKQESSQKPEQKRPK